MPNIIVDKALCTKCNICSSICLMGIIKPAADADFPCIQAANEKKCMLCGHCEAFCPAQALTLDYLVEEKIPFIRGESCIEPERLALYMRSRRSIRHFRPEPVDKETIRQILETARYAPSGGNSQTVQWLVIYDTEEVKKIAGLTVEWMRTVQNTPHPFANYVSGIIKAWDLGFDPICRNAPHLVFAHLPVSDFVDDRTDAIIALSHFDVAAPAFGVGCCWAGFIRMAVDSYPPLLEALALPDKHKVGYGLFFGYPKYQVGALARRQPIDVVWR